MISIEILLSDLNDEGKKKFTKAGIELGQTNWEIYPIAVVEIDDELIENLED